MLRCVLDRLRDRDAQAPGRSGVGLEYRAARVCVLGRAGDDARSHVSIIERRYGFCSYETLTMYTLHSSPKNCAASATAALPHCPAPVSVAMRFRPDSFTK